MQVREQFLVKLHKGLGRGSSNLQNLKSYLTKELQKVPKKAATPMYTVSGQLPSRCDVDKSTEEDKETSTSLVVVGEKVGLGKRASREGVDEPKKKRGKV